MRDNIQLGKLITGKANRDAIHVAVVPLIAGQPLHGGDEFKLAYGSNEIALHADRAYDDNALGIIDPFLSFSNSYIEKGQRVYGLLFPNTVTGMRHHWAHPAFDKEPVHCANDHEVWLRKFAEKWNFDYDDMISAALTQDYVVARGKDLHSGGELGDDLVLFWHHMEALTGKKFSKKHKESTRVPGKGKPILPAGRRPS